MGGKLALEAMAEFIDTGLDAEEVDAIRQTLLDVHGVRGLHELRTRKMADNALVTRTSWSIPRSASPRAITSRRVARQAVLKKHHVMDVMVHIDPEDDLKAKPNVHLPSRPGLMEHLAERLGERHWRTTAWSFTISTARSMRRYTWANRSQPREPIRCRRAVMNW